MRTPGVVMPSMKTYSTFVNPFVLMQKVAVAFILLLISNSFSAESDSDAISRFENGYAEKATKEVNDKCLAEQKIVFKYQQSEHFNPYSYNFSIVENDKKYSVQFITTYNKSVLIGKRVLPVSDTFTIPALESLYFTQLISVFRNYKMDSTSYLQCDGPSYKFRLCGQRYNDSNYEIGFGQIKPDTPNQIAFCEVMHKMFSELSTKAPKLKSLNVCRLDSIY